jgi:hypothetical protein
VRFALEQKDKSRQIESKDKRIVHFLFDTGVPSKESTFARAYKRFQNGTFKKLREEEKQKYTGYIERLTENELEEGERNPIIYRDMTFFNCELTGGLNRLCFSTADDPF